MRKANELAQIASSVKMGEELTHKLIVIEKKYHPSISKIRINLDIFNSDMNIVRDWRTKYREYLENPKKRFPT